MTGTDNYRYFKFRPINKYLIDSLVTPSLWFSRPAELNDPFDCQLNLRASFEKAAKLATGRNKQFIESALGHFDLLDDYGQVFKDCGICSFSLQYRRPAMWSHYADEHRGVCIVYEFPADFINESENKFLGVDKVHYDTRALVDSLVNLPSTEMKRFLNELIRYYVTTKHWDWRFETEARMIRAVPGLMPIPPEFIKQICFGLRTSEEDMNLIARLAESYCNSPILAKIVRTKAEMGFRAKPFLRSPTGKSSSTRPPR